MRAYVYGVVGFVLGVLGTLGLGEFQQILSRLDRIEGYLSRVSHLIGG